MIEIGIVRYEAEKKIKKSVDEKNAILPFFSFFLLI